jgi:hypothetical protein
MCDGLYRAGVYRALSNIDCELLSQDHDNTDESDRVDGNVSVIRRSRPGWSVSSSPLLPPPTTKAAIAATNLPGFTKWALDFASSCPSSSSCHQREAQPDPA